MTIIHLDTLSYDYVYWLLILDSPAPEDLEVAKLSMRDLQSDPDVDSISFEHSEQDTSYRCTGEFSVWPNYTSEISPLCLA